MYTGNVEEEGTEEGRRELPERIIMSVRETTVG